MPTYTYACTECDEQLEVVQSFDADPLTECPRCSGRLRKVFHPVGVVFKGSGFYRTDSRSSKTSTSSASSSTSSSSGSTAGKESSGTSSSAPATGSSTSGSTSGSGSSSSSGSGATSASSSS